MVPTYLCHKLGCTQQGSSFTLLVRRESGVRTTLDLCIPIIACPIRSVDLTLTSTDMSGSVSTLAGATLHGKNAVNAAGTA